MTKTRIQAFQLLMVFFLIGFVATACETTPTQPSVSKTAYSTVKSAAIAYDATMSALGDLDKQGKITSAQKTVIIKYGEEFWRAYHVAVDALIAYKKTGGDSISLDSALSTLTAALAGFLEYSAEITK